MSNPLVRPSLLNIAQRCQLAQVLAEEYPHTTEEAEQGGAVDNEACRDLAGGEPATDPDARALVWWTREHVYDRQVQARLRLIDPETGADLTRPGRADVVGLEYGEGTLVVVDFKSKGQYWNGLPPPDDNLQTHAYALAAALSGGHESYRVCLLLFGDGAVQELWSRTYTRADWPPILEKIRKICAQALARGDIRPRGLSGPHCTGCYQRRNCAHWLLPSEHIGTELAPVATPGGITSENAERVLLARERLSELLDRVDLALREYADRQPIIAGDKQWGPQWQKGKRSASVADLERAGLTDFIRTGDPFRVYKFRRRQ